MCVCLFPERVTICEGGVDISDSDDEDESRCHLFYFIMFWLPAEVWGGWEGGAIRSMIMKQAVLKSSLHPYHLILWLDTNESAVLLFVQTSPRTSTSVTRRCSSSPNMFHRKSPIILPFLCLPVLFFVFLSTRKSWFNHSSISTFIKVLHINLYLLYAYWRWKASLCFFTYYKKNPQIYRKHYYQ